MDKHSQPSNASPSSPKQKYKQKHHHSSPSLAAQASLSLPPPPLPPSGSTSIPPPLPPRACDATGSSNAPPSIPPSSSQQQQQPPTSSSAVFSSFSGYHINRISSAISKNTQQLFRSFSNITTNPTGNGSLASSGAKTIAKAFSKASSREDNLDQEEEGLNRGAAGADSLDGKGAGGVGGAPTSAASMDDMLVRGEDSGLNNGGGPYDDHRPRDLELPSSVTPESSSGSPKSGEGTSSDVIAHHRFYGDDDSDDVVMLRHPHHQPRSLMLNTSSDSLNSATSSSTDNIIEQVSADTPFAGLLRGSTVPMEFVAGASDTVSTSEGTAGSGGTAEKHYSPPLDPGTNAVGERLSNPLLSPLEEAEEWARINEIMASFGSGLARESVFMAELEQEFQQRLGLSLSASQQGLGILANVTAKTDTPNNSATTTGDTQPAAADDAGAAEEANTSTDQDNNTTSSSTEQKFESVSHWLNAVGLHKYESLLLNKGYDHLNFLNGVLLDPELAELNITDPDDCSKIKAAVSRLPASLPPTNTSYKVPGTVQEWLDSIQLPQYLENFNKSGFGCMERVRKMWEVELTMVLEVTKPGHRRRILASLGDRPIEPALPHTLDPKDLSVELSKLNNDICELKEQLFADLPSVVSRERRPPESNSATIRRSVKKTRAPLPPALQNTRAQPTLDTDGTPPECVTPPPEAGVPPPPNTDPLPLRGPSQLVLMDHQSSSSPSSAGSGQQQQQQQLSSWKHEPSKLISSSVKYVAQYLGSTHVLELRGTESTMRSIHKLRRAVDARGGANVIVLGISYQGVKFLHHDTKEVICEHEIRNIHCACQDADDLSHFAYITKDIQTKGHYCHVFRVDTRDQATDIILTLGEAFEVAYQLALREQHKSKPSSHTRTRSDSCRTATTNNSSSHGSHNRSHSTVVRDSSTDHQHPQQKVGATTSSTQGARACSSDSDSDIGSIEQQQHHRHHRPT